MNFIYPEGKTRALTFSFDDNQSFDRKLVAIFNKYGMKGTFNLNSGTLGYSDDETEFIKKEEVKELYKGHEVAVHGKDHKFLFGLPDSMIINEFLDDRRALEEITGEFVQGCAYAFGWHNQKAQDLLHSLGIKYARGVDNSNFFFPPMDFLNWQPTCHQEAENLFDLAKTFLEVPSFIELPIMYVWGHSFEFGRSGDWSRIEKFCEMMSNNDDIWYATNLEICNYILATRSLEFSGNGLKVYNPTLLTIWATENGKTFTIKPGETKNIAPTDKIF